MPRKITFFAAMCLLWSGLGVRMLADEVKLKNGDRITGTIVKADGKTLTIKTEYAGIINIMADVVAQIASEQTLWFALDDGKTVVGKVATKEGKYEIETREAALVSIEPGKVQAIRSRPEQEEYERLLHPSWLDLWDTNANLGYDLTTGNIRTNTLGLAATLVRRTNRDKTTLYATYVESKNNTSGVTETTANAIRGGARYEIDLTGRWVAFGFADFEFNEIQLLDLRTVLGGGIGYYFIRNDRTQFQVFGGGAYNREKFSTGLIRNSGELLIGEEFSFKLSERVSFQERFQFFPNMSDTGEYRITFDAGVNSKLTKWLTWNITVSDRYISNPPFGSRNNDLLLTTGLGVTLDRFNFKRW
jgi:putative salt-induced outer membrane protein YdiY